MTKCLLVDPKVVRHSSKVQSPVIEVNKYQKTIKDERKFYNDQDLMGIWHDMVVIREFESMLNMVKTEGVYHGVSYNHAGPAHLSIGQEAAAVGMAFNLTSDDYIFGSHRSHGEILAKGLSAIKKLDSASLQTIMENYLGGAILKVVADGFSGSNLDLAKEYLLYGALAEIFGRATGFNKGLGGSMHAFFPPFGIYPNNAIVGGSADIATGAALFKKVNRKKGIVVCNIGDASIGCGPVWEALGFASMQQYDCLWGENYRGGLPIIFNFFNNFYGMGGQPQGETMGFDMLVRVAMAVNAEAMNAERVDGYNPLAVIDAFRRKKHLIVEENTAPVFLDTITYRVSGHSPSDASSYRAKEEIELWKNADPIIVFKKELIQEGVSTEGDLNAIQDRIIASIDRVYNLAIDLKKSPRLSPRDVESVMFSNMASIALDNRPGETLAAKEDSPQYVNISKKIRSGIVNGAPVSKNKTFQFRDGIFEAMLHRFYNDPTFIAYGEENRDWGGAFACYRGLTEVIPYHRLFNAPISEAAIVGTAVGYALSGGRVCAELMYCDFMGRAGDEIFNQLAKWQSMSAGILKMPAVIRISVGAKYGAQHSQDWSAMVAHVPGLKVVFPVTPYDAKGMLNAALNGTDPVIFFESQRVYDIGEMFEPEVPLGYYEVEIGMPAKRRNGSDITIITLGATLYRAIVAADRLENHYGLKAEIFDTRSINPLNYEPFIESAKKTGRVLLASDACDRGSFLHTMASNLQRYVFDFLDAPIAVVGARNWITPCAEMEDAFFPSPDWIIDTIHEQILPLPGHTVKSVCTNGEHIRQNRLGV